jgi:hypothetical protein
MKYALCSLLLCLSLVAAAQQANPNSSPDSIDPSPVLRIKFNSRRQAISTSLYLVPGQELRVDNAVFNRIHIMSDLPVVVRIGKCQATQTTDIRCETTPNLYIHVQDLRIGVPIDGAALNRIYLTATKE